MLGVAVGGYLPLAQDGLDQPVHLDGVAGHPGQSEIGDPAEALPQRQIPADDVRERLL